MTCYWAHFTFQKLYLPRGKVLGGSTSINNNFYVWGSKHDYNRWARSGASGWTYGEIVGHFINVEDSRLINGSNGQRGNKGEIKLSNPHQTPLGNTHFLAGKELSKMARRTIKICG